VVQRRSSAAGADAIDEHQGVVEQHLLAADLDQHRGQAGEVTEDG
jgi:hypothetical protein